MDCAEQNKHSRLVSRIHGCSQVCLRTYADIHRPSLEFRRDGVHICEHARTSTYACLYVNGAISGDNAKFAYASVTLATGNTGLINNILTEH